MTKTQEQLIRAIDQQLENVMHFSDELSEKYHEYLYYPNTDDEPIVERFTPQLLKELEELVYELDND
jgi:hypothetical protein